MRLADNNTIRQKSKSNNSIAMILKLTAEARLSLLVGTVVEVAVLHSLLIYIHLLFYYGRLWS